MVHGRAVRLTKRRLEAAAPFSIAEMQADKDQLRAEFAIANRRLEMTLEGVKERAVAQMAELGEKTEAVSRFKAEVDTKAAAIAGLEGTVKRLTDNLTAATDEIELKRAAQADAERDLAELRSKLAEAESRYGESSTMADRQRIEIVATQTQLATLKDQFADAQRTLAETERKLREAQAEAAAARQVGRQEVEADLQGEIIRLGHVYDATTAALRTDKLQLEGQLERARGERNALQRERPDPADASPADAADGDAAVLRERVSDVAAEVARLTAALEGANSPLEAIMRRSSAPRATGRTTERPHRAPSPPRAGRPPTSRTASAPCRAAPPGPPRVN